MEPLQALQERVEGGFLADFRRSFGDDVLGDWVQWGLAYRDDRRQIVPPTDPAEAVIFACMCVATFGQYDLWPDLEEVKVLISRHRAEVQAMGCLTTPPSKIGMLTGHYDFIFRPWLGRADEAVIFWRG